MDLSDAMPDCEPVDIFLVLAIAKCAFEGDQLTLLKGFGELRKIAPGEDAVPFGARFVVAFVVLPALLGGDVEGDELAVVLSGFGFCILSEAADESDFVEYDVLLRFS
jgi:hypothetical protein